MKVTVGNISITDKKFNNNINNIDINQLGRKAGVNKNRFGIINGGKIGKTIIIAEVKSDKIDKNIANRGYY